MQGTAARSVAARRATNCGHDERYTARPRITVKTLEYFLGNETHAENLDFDPKIVAVLGITRAHDTDWAGKNRESNKKKVYVPLHMQMQMQHVFLKGHVFAKLGYRTGGRGHARTDAAPALQRAQDGQGGGRELAVAGRLGPQHTASTTRAVFNGLEPTQPLHTRSAMPCHLLNVQPTVGLFVEGQGSAHCVSAHGALRLSLRSTPE